ncbi:MAG: Type 1 glutamine amidotransferase-like domain-containing protein [Candidatus Pacebacteria bacterium]|nr:Type 1 glutamine amidotransferase-like domain-containing protein [Candidatus Paceibacterota bacterium]
MKLLLTSSGIKEAPELQEAFLDLTDHRKDLLVAIIPTAGDPIEWVLEKEGDVAPYDSVAKLVPEKKEKNLAWWHSMQEAWEKKGHRAIIVDLKEDPVEVRKKLENADIIEVTGGDGNWLVDWAKKAKLDVYLKDILNQGVIYYGTSAGSCLVTPDFGLGWWDKRWKLDHMGLGIVNFCVAPHQLAPHQKEKTIEEVKTKIIEQKKNYQAEFSWKIYLLQDGQAIKVDGDKVAHIGEGLKQFI